jgi:putative peptidoglycan lipid II flippase
VPQLIHRIIAPGFSGQTFANTVTLTKIFLLSPIIFTASSIFGSVLNSLNRFLMVSLAPVLYNLGIMFGAVFLYPRFGIAGLAYGVIVGALAHLLTQIIGAAAAGFRYHPRLAISNDGVKKIFQLFLPRVIGVDNSLISLIIASYFGSFLAAGSIAIFNFSNNLEMVPMGIFSLSFATAAFPNLSQYFAKHDESNFNQTLSKTAVNISYFMIPSSVLLIVLRAQIVRVIYGTGQFNWNATRLTANALGLFAIGLFAQALTPLMSRAFYARQNTIIPVVAGLVAIVANAFASYFLIRPFGVAGLALGFSLSTILNALILYVALRPRLVGFSIRQPAMDILKILFSSLVLAAGSYYSLYLVQLAIPLTRTLYVLAQGAMAAVVGLLIYFLCTKWLGMDQSALAVSLVKRKFVRK